MIRRCSASPFDRDKSFRVKEPGYKACNDKEGIEPKMLLPVHFFYNATASARKFRGC